MGEGSASKFSPGRRGFQAMCSRGRTNVFLPRMMLPASQIFSPLSTSNVWSEDKTMNLDGLRVASPCSASWYRMTGDDRVRFCDQCRKNERCTCWPRSPLLPLLLFFPDPDGFTWFLSCRCSFAHASFSLTVGENSGNSALLFRRSGGESFLLEIGLDAWLLTAEVKIQLMRILGSAAR